VSDKGVIVTCCYCGRKQAADPPPGLVTCVGCMRDFRTLVNYAGGPPMELTAEAKSVLGGKESA
jgi:hypothetical protein